MSLSFARSWLLFASLATVVACASSGASASSDPSAARSARRDPYLITRAELEDPALVTLNALEAIRSLRPNFLLARGQHGIGGDAGQVQVSVDGGSLLPVDDLQRLPVRIVNDIRFLSASAAMQRFGSTAREGPVILVRTLSR